MDQATMPEKYFEKMTVDPEDFAALQVDYYSQRFRTGANLIHQEKVFLRDSRTPVQVDDGLQVVQSEKLHGGILGRMTDRLSGRGSSKKRRIFLAATLITLAIIAVIVGAVLGSRSASSNSSSSSLALSPTSTSTLPTSATPSAAPSIINDDLPKTDIMAASPLAPIAFVPKDSSNIEAYSLFFQSAAGTTKFTNRNGLSGLWAPALDIFGDAINGTGIAALTYLNGSSPQSTIYYVGSSNTHIREKRESDSGYWASGPLTQMNVPISGNSSSPGEGDTTGLRLTAVYSERFPTGPGARLFFHQNNDTAAWVQELIWTQNNDSWAYGAQIPGPQPGSHICAVIEPASQSLRLFYSTTDNAVKEVWYNITEPSPTYQSGVELPGLLLHQYADFAVMSTSNSTFLYYSSSLSANSNVTIRELVLPLLPNTSVSSASSVLIAEPALQAADSGGKSASLFVPLAAVAAPQGNAITVFYPEDVVDPRSGYGRLQSVWREVGESWVGNVSYGQGQNMMSVDLGDTV